MSERSERSIGTVMKWSLVHPTAVATISGRRNWIVHQ